MCKEWGDNGARQGIDRRDAMPGVQLSGKRRVRIECRRRIIPERFSCP
jgi:hypothetical protein